MRRRVVRSYECAANAHGSFNVRLFSFFLMTLTVVFSFPKPTIYCSAGQSTLRIVP